MDLRGAAGVVALFVTLLVPAKALAWQEAHEVGDDVEVRVEPNGLAAVEHSIRWHVVRGPLKSIDLVNVAPSAVLEPEVRVKGDDGRDLTAHLARHDDRTVRIIVDEPRALMRGTFTFDVRWNVDLAVAHALVRDGSTWRLVWSAPVASDGFDSGRTVFDFPSAPDAPQAIVADTGAVDDGAVSSLRRDPGRDILELVRPHVARGESCSWTLRVDPRALPGMTDAHLRVTPPAAVPDEPDRVRVVSLGASLAALAVTFGLLVAKKTAAFDRACTARGGRALGLLPLPLSVRAAAAGIALSAGVGLEAIDCETMGGVLVGFSVLAAVVRCPDRRPIARGPGRWLILRPEDAFVPDRASHWLDIEATAGRIAAVVVVVLVAGAAVAGYHIASKLPWLFLFDAAPLVPLFTTGRWSQLPPDGARSAVPFLAPAFRRLRRLEQLRVVPWARVVTDGGRPDELRLLVLPRAPMPGLIGVEIGVAWHHTPVGWVAGPEVLVRILEASAAAAKLARLAPSMRSLPGRRMEERVGIFAPSRSGSEGTAALATALAEALTDRRADVPAEKWTAPERRAPQAARVVEARAEAAREVQEPTATAAAC
jgi:hypothetical protein